ncbi:hypothetical protein [Natranaeroarchaeum sulfidigenes]|uniref:hypothetical protein n=1 Tax=Natranaeroarchaeum sulfidigenes TaxID=2784880 RepID=UPI001EE56F57|nr:hypothetical protein [Natranaeroarchaeum sulfidigenes]
MTIRGSVRTVIGRAVPALSFAVAGNLAVLVLAYLTVGWFGPLSIVPVVLVSTIAGIGAAITYSLLDWRLADPDRPFLAIAAVVLLVSFVSLDFAATLEGATIPRLVVLGITHVVAAAGCVAALVDIDR